ncbi:MAG: metal-dependent hydrolase, partial [Dictyoglomus sp.]
ILQSILEVSNTPVQNILTPWRTGLVIGNTLGTFVPDIDAPHSEISKRILPVRILLNILIPIISLILSFSFYYSSIYLRLKDFKTSCIVFLVIFLFFLVLLTFILKKVINPFLVHRGFFHSILGLVFLNFILSSFYTISLKQLSPNLLSLYHGFHIGINIGYIGHVIGDIFTYQGIRPFFPISWKISFKILKTNSLEEKVLFYILSFANIFVLFKNILK